VAGPRYLLVTLHVRRQSQEVQAALRQGGKLNVPARLNAVDAWMLVHVQCQLTGRRYLVDTGATFSLIPHKSSEPQARHPRLIGPGGQPIRCWGEERLQLQFSGRLFMWTFIKAEVTFPILGVDFLRANCLSVSVATNQLTDDSTGDMFCLIEQPSGQTASIMLPANVPEWNKAAGPPIAPPLGGQGATYAAAAARGGDFTFTRKTPPPAAVPSGVDSGRGAAISTASTLHCQPPPKLGRPQSVATLTSIGEIIATFQDVLNPKGDLQRMSDDVAHHLQTRGPPSPPSSGGWTARN
jgi:hypothetical protein